MGEGEWHDLREIDAEESEFPVAATVGGEDIVIFQIGDDYRGAQRLCPHKDGDFVRRGVIMGNGKMLRCSLHGFIFNLASGKGVNAGPQCIDIFEIRRDVPASRPAKKQP